MQESASYEKFAPLFAADIYSQEEAEYLKPFFTNLDRSVYSPLGLSPEVIGALCSRTSRARADLRRIFGDEYLVPFLSPQRETEESDEAWAAKQQYQQDLSAFIEFVKQHPLEAIFSNPRARSFYSKWLAQYGDDSIAQMAGVHLVFTAISQVAIKHFEDQRIGLAPIEKSTRYVDYSEKVHGQYQYYVDPTLATLGLEQEYRIAMDGLFEAYLSLKPQLINWLQGQFPDEKPKVIETKAFDTLRGLLPMSTLSQVAFFGNGQAFEYLIARSLQHSLGEIRWGAERAYEELSKIVPSFLRRVKDTDPERSKLAHDYQVYKAQHGMRVEPLVTELLTVTTPGRSTNGPQVALLEYDPQGEEKVLTGLLYSAPNNHLPWAEILERVGQLSTAERRKIFDASLAGREQRWQKVHRAFENAFVRFEVVMNIGAWRDLHRHRMLTQQRQIFTCQHGFDVPAELVQAGLDGIYVSAIARVEGVHAKIAAHDPIVAQYAVTLAHRVRFMQWENLRECFWEVELRTIPEGHPDYRQIEQQKFRLLEQAYPLIAERMRVNLGHYDFARRGQEEKVQAKLRELEALSKP